MTSHDMNICDFCHPEDAGDMTPAVRRALAKAKTVNNLTLRFPCGIWHFRPERALEKYCFISNNDHGLKSVAFPLAGFAHLTIDGGGSEFIFHGRILPFALEYCRSVKIRGLTVDVARPFYTQGRIVAAGPGWVELAVDRQVFPYEVVLGKVYFKGDNWQSEAKAILLLTEFDPVRREPAYRKEHTQVRVHELEAEQTAAGHLRLAGNFPIPFSPGNQLLICHEKRDLPTIFISRSEAVTVEDLTIHQSGCMGLIAQVSRDITARRLHVCLRKNTERLVSTTADATHFVNCSGLVTLEDCVFEHMLDDAVNVHGIYSVITALPDARRIEVRLMHPQQAGVPLYAPGDRLTIVDRETLLPKTAAIVEAVQFINGKYALLTLAEALHSGAGEGDALENSGSMPDVLIRRCRTGWNRPRGFLLNTCGKVLVEDCEFHNSHHGIHIAGDANYWYESGPVRDVTIRRCHFEDCGYGFGGTPICIRPSIKRPEENPECYHRNITIENNQFNCFAPGLVSAVSVDGLRFRNNRWRLTGNYQPWEGDRPELLCRACRNVEQENNRRACKDHDRKQSPHL